MVTEVGDGEEEIRRVVYSSEDGETLYESSIPLANPDLQMLVAIYYNNSSETLTVKAEGTSVSIPYVSGDNLFSLYTRADNLFAGNISELVVLNKDMRKLGKSSSMEA